MDSVGGGVGISIGGDGADESRHFATRKVSYEGNESTGGNGLDWLASAKLGGQTERKPREDSDAAAKRTTTKIRLADNKPRKGSNAAMAQSGPGGWMAAAVLSGQLGGEDDADSDDALGPPSEQKSLGVSIETQTDENIGQAIAEQGKPKLPPWAKPWASLPQVAADDPVSAAPSSGEVTGGIEPDCDESSAPDFRGAQYCTSVLIICMRRHFLDIRR